MNNSGHGCAFDMCRVYCKASTTCKSSWIEIAGNSALMPLPCLQQRVFSERKHSPSSLFTTIPNSQKNHPSSSWLRCACSQRCRQSNLVKPSLRPATMYPLHSRGSKTASHWLAVSGTKMFPKSLTDGTSRRECSCEPRLRSLTIPISILSSVTAT